MESPVSLNPSPNLTRLRWYVVHCKPREDERALVNLERQDFECYRPVCQVEHHREGRRYFASEALFPGYLFVRLDEARDGWYRIRSTRGVSQIICRDGRLVPVRDEIVDEIRSRSEQEPAKKPYLQRGERVEINDGVAFVAIEAIFLANDGDERVILLLNILHSEQRLSFPAESVRKLGPGHASVV